jgi:hypothetical protein
MALLQQVTGSAASGASGPRSSEGGKPGETVQSFVQRDERTGETYLKLPVPAPEVLDQVLRSVGALLESLRK